MSKHRFGVAQGEALWQKMSPYPHVLVWNGYSYSTNFGDDIYGDLDVSVIDEMPAGRKPIQNSSSL